MPKEVTLVRVAALAGLEGGRRHGSEPCTSRAAPRASCDGAARREDRSKNSAKVPLLCAGAPSVLTCAVMPQESSTYRFEETLIAHFSACLHAGDSPWGTARVGFEFDYGGGLADVIAQDGTGALLAFEGKLRRWRDALHQAYRTRCFASRAYVVLPESTALTAARYEEEFRRRRVGLCSISREGGIRLLIDSDSGTPLQSWIAARALTDLEAGGCRQMRSSRRSHARSAPHAA